MMRRELRSRGHSRGNTARFDHLVSPLHGVPLCDPSSILLTGGLHDRISLLEDLTLLQSRWPGSSLLQVPQGHFGYAALRETMKQVESRIVG
jgi:hypothetical protein